jgi:1,4-dihydroxy-6-naphthoate synthase
MHPEKIRIGISTCPNDTYAFHALLEGAIEHPGIHFEFQLLDIQDLNQQLFADAFDVAKASFHAAILLADRMVVLQSGSALGFGVGPLLLASKPNSKPTDAGQLTLCPGEHTTAHLLWKLFYSETARVEQVVFSDVMPTLTAGDADFGVCIHEGRFTYADQGLYLVEDLGSRWERETQSPLPLGGILADRRLSQATLGKVSRAIRDSIRYAHANPGEALRSMRRYAQEFDDQTLLQHVELYVNDWTLELGEKGETALHKLSEMAERVGILSSCALEVAKSPSMD